MEFFAGTACLHLQNRKKRQLWWTFTTRTASEMEVGGTTSDLVIELNNVYICVTFLWPF